MEHQTILCPVCRSENQPEYKFCKSCGTLLHASPAENPAPSPYPPSANSGVNPPGGYGPDPQQIPPSPGAHAQPPYAGYPTGQQPPPNAQQAGYAPPYAPTPPYAASPMPDIDGVPADVVGTFVGTGANYYVRRFAKMAATGSKASWNWAAFLLSFFLNFGGAAIWFFRRKMFGLGAFFSGIYAVLQSVNIYLSVRFLHEVMPYIQMMLHSMLQGNSSGFRLNLPLDHALFSWGVLLVNLALSICMGIFANAIYKKHCMKTIRSIQAQEPGATPDILRKKGGVSAAWLIGLAVILLMMVVSLVLTIGPIFSISSELFDLIDYYNYYY